jgi:4-amino-4-deoxy-L-arabinose transferase-like glycosyltransferase
LHAWEIDPGRHPTRGRVRGLKERSTLDLTALLLVLALALGLRLYRLGDQSLWYDEGFSVFLAQLEPARIISWTAADIQPPLYYLLLHGWIRVWGNSEAAVRGLSLLFGVLCVPLIYGLAWRVSRSRTAALAAAVLLAVSPVHLWYSQEARMYTLLVFLSLLSSYFLLRAVHARTDDRSLAWWAAFSLVSAAALYTHYFAGSVLAFQALYTLWWVIRDGFRRRCLFWGGLAAHLAVGLAYLPWLPHLLIRYGADASYWPGQLKLSEALVDTAVFLVGGESVSEPVGVLLAIALGVALFVSVLALWTGREATANEPSMGTKQPAAAFLLLFLLVPLISVLALSYRSPKFNPRYAMVSHPALLLILSAGLATLWKQQRRHSATRLRQTTAVLMLTFLIGTSAYADWNLYANPVFARADFRGAVAYLEEQKRPDETIILVSGHMAPVFDYYAPDAERHLLPDSPTLDVTRTLDYSIAADLNRWLADRPGVWVVLWQDEVADPVGYLTTMLGEGGTEQHVEPTFGEVVLKHYALPGHARFSEQPTVAEPADVNFGNRLRFLGHDQVGPLQVMLFWQALQPLAEDYRVSLLLRDEQGQVWGRWDGRPSAYLYPTSRWRVGQIVFGRYDLQPLPGTPPGGYDLELGVYTEADPDGLDILDLAGAPQGKRALIGAVQLPLLSARADQIHIPHRVEADMGGGLQLLGWEIDHESAQPGDRRQLGLFWLVTSAPHSDYEVRLVTTDGQGQVLDIGRVLPTRAGHPTSAWEPGQVWRGQHTFKVPIAAPAGELHMAVQLVEASGLGAGPVLELGEIEVLPTERVFVAPELQVEVYANLDDKMALLGGDLTPVPVSPGGRLRVTLAWQALAEMDVAYSVFVHLLGSDGRVIAGHDGEPAGGTRPTTGWVPGEYISDSHELTIPSDLGTGAYDIEVGMYDAAIPGMPRVRVLRPEGQLEADHVLLGAVQVQ